MAQGVGGSRAREPGGRVVSQRGLVAQAEGDLPADRAATIEGVERIVKVFEYID